MTFFVKPGGAYEAWKTDTATCHEVAWNARLDDLPQGDPLYLPTYVGGGVGTYAGGMIGSLFIVSVHVDKQREVAEGLCMRNLGYVAVPLTAKEASVYRHIWVGAADGWRTKFLAQDLTARLSAATATRLPPYRDEPMTQGGLKIEAASLAAATGIVTANGAVLTGKAQRWRTAVLAEPFATADGFVQVAGAPGAVFYQVDYRPQKEPLLRPFGATWCGPVIQTSKQQPKPSSEIYCFTGGDGGYEVRQSNGYSWYSGPPGDGLVLPPFAGPILLQERANDDLGPIDFILRAADVKEGHVDLQAILRHDGQEVVLWKRRLKFEAGGNAILQLWSHRLVLTREGADGVKVTLDDKGDGHGWRDSD